MVGTSINIFVKTGKKAAGEIAEVYYSDAMGTRSSKYEMLEANTITTLPFQKVEVVEPYYFFVPQNNEGREEYDKGFKIDELMTINSVGIVTARDGFTIHESPQVVENVINDFLSISDEAAREKFALGKDVRDWTVASARKDLLNTPRNIVPVLYRPFDRRYTNYTGHSKGFHCMPRGEVMRHLVRGSNLGLLLCKHIVVSDWCHVGISDTIVDDSLVSNRTKERGYVFPLYLYPNSEQPTIDGNERVPNLNKEIWDKIETIVGQVTPEQIFDYIYGVLHTPSYRTKYKEFLKVDFPRIPYPASKDEFDRIAHIGTQLRKLHLMEVVPPMPGVAQFTTSGDNLVEKLAYQNGGVFINTTQCFSNVPELAWDFYIGGYQPAQKWLKDRKGRNLTFDDILHYRNIIIVLLETDRLMKELDNQ